MTADDPLAQDRRPLIADRHRLIAALLVEDDPADAGLVRRALRNSGGRFAVSHCMSLAEALARVRKEPCDVVLLDLSLPDSHGFGTIRRMREAFPAMPLVVLTGHDDADFAVEAMAAGTQDYLVKGATDGPSLYRAIRYAIARMQLEERLRQSERRLQSIINLAQDAIVVSDGEGRIVLFNPAAERLFGYPAADVLGGPIGILLPERFRPAHEDSVDNFGEHGTTTRTRTGLVEVVGLRRDGVEFPAEVAISRDEHLDGVLLTAVIRDITARRRIEDELRRLATIDALTGLSNRRWFMEAADAELDRMRRYGRPTTVLMLDVDHFKRINDTHGHAAGDEALKRLAAACRRILRSTDLIGRLGGEEFAVILPETDLPATLEVAERLREAIGALAIPTANGSTFPMTVSIGVSPCVSADPSIERPLARADRALYRAKETGRNRVEAEPPAP